MLLAEVICKLEALLCYYSLYGLFEVLLIRMPRQIIDVPKILISITNGDFSDKHIYFAHSHSVKFTTAGCLDWSLDGEHALSEGEVGLKNIHNAISIVF